MSDQTEELILNLERAYFPLPSLTARITAVEQSLAALWASFGAAPPTNTTFSGSVDGCSGTGVAGIVVNVVNHATSAVLDTVTTDGSGNFSGAITLSGSLSVDFVAGGTNWTTTTLNFTVVGGTSNTVGSIGLTAATGYICAPGCNEPVNKTLTVVDSDYGTYTATYQGTFSGLLTWQTTGVTVAYTGDGSVPCAASANVPVTYTLTNGGTWASKATYVAVSLLNGCPLATGTSAATTVHTLGTVACPPGLSVAFTNAAAQRYYSHAAAATYSITWSG